MQATLLTNPWRPGTPEARELRVYVRSILAQQPTANGSVVLRSWCAQHPATVIDGQETARLRQRFDQEVTWVRISHLEW